jgi:hypothetical protein
LTLVMPTGSGFVSEPSTGVGGWVAVGLRKVGADTTGVTAGSWEGTPLPPAAAS